MSKFYDKPSSDLLYQALLEVQDLEECRRFLQDLCTVSELKAMEQRMEVAMLLDQGLIYSDILERTGASSATISRVNRCLHYGADGYRAILPRLKEQRDEQL
jgi:TrpR-related protein YerC/YecD